MNHKSSHSSNLTYIIIMFKTNFKEICRDINVGYTPIWRCICEFGHRGRSPRLSKFTHTPTKRCITGLNYMALINFNSPRDCAIYLVPYLIFMEEYDESMICYWLHHSFRGTVRRGSKGKSTVGCRMKTLHMAAV